LISAAVVGLFLLKNLFRYLALVAISNFRNGIVRDLRRRIYDKLLSWPLAITPRSGRAPCSR
jgi:subfamily B ATP-binding cassette protein MsbA